jgi:hypothetical protein
MVVTRPGSWYALTRSLLALVTVVGSFTAAVRAQDEAAPAAPAQMPEPVAAPAVKARFGVVVGDYANGNVHGAIVVGVYQNSPATRVVVKTVRPDGSVVYGEPTTMIRGDIITRLVEAETGQSWAIRGVPDLIDAVQALPPGAVFEIRGYDAGRGYRRFTAVAKLGGGGGGLSESRRVRALLIADTSSELPGLDKNLEKVRALLQPLQQEDRCSIETFRGDQVNRDRIMSWVNRLGDASGDTVFVYYCGHGATDTEADPDRAQRTFGHYLALTNGRPLFRSSLRRGLAQRQPRLTVLITECCSNVVPVAPLGAPPVMDPRLARSLFLTTRGVVDFTAATFDPQTGVEESAWTTEDGGLFTSSLEDTLVGAGFEGLDTSPTDGRVTWTEVFPRVRGETNKSYQDMRKMILMNTEGYRPRTVGALRDQREQRPWAFALEGR